MLSSKEAFLLKLKEGIADEMYSYHAFKALAKRLPEGFDKAFLTYADEEKSHADTLIALFEAHSGEPFILEAFGEVEIDDVLLFLITYKSEEESAIFLYESLYAFSEDEKEKEVFGRIKEEEAQHLVMIENLISVYKERSLA